MLRLPYQGRQGGELGHNDRARGIHMTEQTVEPPPGLTGADFKVRCDAAKEPDGATGANFGLLNTPNVETHEVNYDSTSNHSGCDPLDLTDILAALADEDAATSKAVELAEDEEVEGTFL